MNDSDAELQSLKQRYSAWLMDHDGVVSVILNRGRLTVIVEHEDVRQALPGEIEGHALHVVVDGPAILEKLPRPPDEHRGTHDDCLLCDYVLASRLIEMGGEPEWVSDDELE